MNSTLKSLLFWMVLVVVGVLIWNFSTILTTKSENTLPFSQFLKQVDAGGQPWLERDRPHGQPVEGVPNQARRVAHGVVL